MPFVGEDDDNDDESYVDADDDDKDGLIANSHTAMKAILKLD